VDKYFQQFMEFFLPSFGPLHRIGDFVAWRPGECALCQFSQTTLFAAPGNGVFAVILLVCYDFNSWKNGVNMDIASIKKMTMVERLQAMELLWDSLSRDESELESPDWHHKVLVDRRKTLTPEKMVPLSEVKKNLAR